MDKFGIDVGGVLIDRVKGDDSDTSMFSDRYLETPEVEGAIDTLAKLGSGRWKGNLFIVSKAGNRMRAKTMEWLGHRKFWERTGMAPEQAFFTFQRHEKAGVAKQLGLTHFVDDRLEILASLQGICRSLYLFRGSPNEIRPFEKAKAAVVEVTEWKALGELLA